MSSDLLVHNVFYLNKLITNFFSGKKIVFLIIPDTRLTMKLDINLDAQQKIYVFHKVQFRFIFHLKAPFGRPWENEFMEGTREGLSKSISSRL